MFARLLLWSLLLLAPCAAQPLRLGEVSYEDLNPAHRRALPSQPRIVRAAGSYRELSYWWERGWLDVAIVTPGLLKSLPSASWTYLGSAPADDQRSVLVVRKDSPLTDWKQLQAYPDLQYLAVDPASMSGYLLPMQCLGAEGLKVPPERVRFTHSHTNVIRAVASSRQPALGMCWEGSWKAHSHPDLRVLELPSLEKLSVPGMALVARPELDSLKSLQIQVQRGAWPGFRHDSRYLDRLSSLPSVPDRPESMQESVDLEDLVWTLHQYNRTHPQPARLGLVLSGGGAKCSYQAGAVRALEEQLMEGRKRLQDQDLRIHLVVGTSGGAINAVAVALGLTESPEGFQQLRKAWGDLDQRELVCPPLGVRINMWLWFACIGLLSIAATRKILGLSAGRTHLLTLCAGLLLGLLVRLPVKPWSLLGTDSNLQHFWAWVSRGLEGAGWVLVVTAALGHFQRRRLPLWLPIAGVTLLPLIQTWNILFHQEVVSENVGLERALQRNFGRLIAFCSQVPNPRSGGVAELSRQVLSQNLLKRDLALAASPLTDPQQPLPAEYYFFAPTSGLQPQRFGPRGVSLAQRPELLFDAVLGSAAIYPLFPSRRVQDLPSPGKSVDLVDGSFAHRSPLEAAVLWEATHILVIEASTTEVARRGHLLANLGASLNFLYDEAQLVDVRQKGETVLFTLYPQAPHIGLLDFSDNLIQSSIDKGYREAQQGLQKRLGPPKFLATDGAINP